MTSVEKKWYFTIDGKVIWHSDEEKNRTIQLNREKELALNKDNRSSKSDDDLAKKLLKPDDKRKTGDVEEKASSGSDSDDPDTEKMDVGDGPSDPKKAKTAPAKFEEGLKMETELRYLRRELNTMTELLHKMDGVCGEMSKSEKVMKSATILKTVEPHLSEQLKDKTEDLSFSLANTVA